MTVEFTLLLTAIFVIALKFLASAPMDAFKNSAPRLGARIEKHISSGTGFNGKDGSRNQWEDGK